jgi:hypothetical protein
MNVNRKTLLTALAVAGALTTGVAAALAGGGDVDYGSAALVQAGHGPGGPPSEARVSVEQVASPGGGKDYGSAAMIQLGHRPGGPRAER